MLKSGLTQREVAELFNLRAPAAAALVGSIDPSELFGSARKKPVAASDNPFLASGGGRA